MCLIAGCHAGSRYHQIPDYTIGLTLPVYLYILYVPDQQSVLGRYILHSRTCFQIHSDHIPCRMAAHRCRWDADGSCSTKLGYDLLTLTVLTSILLCFSSRAFKLSRTEKIIFVLLSVLCIVIENLIVAGQVNIHTGSPETYADLLSAICFLILILFVSLTIYLYHLGIEREKNIQLSRQQLLSEMERKQYDQIISSISELRYLKHDISNHLDTLHALMVNHAYPEAEAFIRDLTATVNNNHYILASGNSTVDSILTNKLIQCKSAQIQVEYSVFLPDSIPLSDIELCSLLGNLFDNAIEACEQLPETEQRSIDFSMKPFQNMLSIVISNRTNGYYRIDKKNHFLSTKTIEDTPEHGLGLSRIQSIVNDHNGIFNIQPTTDTFMIQILLPLK